MIMAWIAFLCVAVLISMTQGLRLSKESRQRFATSSLVRESTQSDGPIPRTLRDSVIKESKAALPFLFAIAAPFILPAVASANKEISFLTDPTDEFKEEEKRTKAYSDEQKKVKGKWDVLLYKLRDYAGENPIEIEAMLVALIKFLEPLDGIPIGLKKKELVMICRSKKFLNEKKRKIKPSWTKECEIAYQELIQLFNKKVLPLSESKR